ncbi:MAG: hypothetical protein ACYC4L_11260 [Chloroflexota bacterium]
MSANPGRVLLVGEGLTPVAALLAILRAQGHEVLTAACESAPALVTAAARADVLVVAGEGCADHCLSLLAAVRAAQPGLPIILIGRGCQVDTALRALKLGLVDYLSRPVNPQKLRERVDEAIERRACLTELSGWHAIQGRS